MATSQNIQNIREDKREGNGSNLEDDGLNRDDLTMEEEEKSYWTEQYRIVAWLDNVSKSEKFCHVQEPDTNKDITIVTPNRRDTINKFKFYIKERGEIEDEGEILKAAEREFKKKVDEPFRDRYERIKKLPSHPALPKVHWVQYDEFVKAHLAFLDYVPGSPFLSVTLGPFQILKLLGDAFDGLSHMHDRGLLHRRIKSENVYIYHEGSKPVLKFVSWGLAIPFEKAKEDRSANGKGIYTAPEVLEEGEINETTDMYALGVMGYKLIAGQFPHKARSLAQNLSELKNIIKDEKEARRLSEYRHIQNMSSQERQILKIDKLDYFFSELLKRDPASRAFKTAVSAANFLRQNWARGISEATDPGHTFSVTMG